MANASVILNLPGTVNPLTSNGVRSPLDEGVIIGFWQLGGTVTAELTAAQIIARNAINLINPLGIASVVSGTPGVFADGLVLDGTNYINTGITEPQSTTLIGLCKHESGTGGWLMGNYGVPTAANGLGIYRSAYGSPPAANLRGTISQENTGGAGTTVSASATVVDPDFVSWSMPVQIARAGVNVEMRELINNPAPGITALIRPRTFGTSPILLGRAGSAGSFPGAFRIRYAMIAARALTDAEILTVRAWMLSGAAASGIVVA